MALNTKQIELNSEQVGILEHTANRAVDMKFCGDSEDMDRLVELGLMKFIGRVSWVPSGYYTITEAGLSWLAENKR